MSALQARLNLPRVALYAALLAALTLIAIMYLAMTQWFAPWQPLALMALLSIPLGGFSAYVALELPIGTALKPDHVIPGALVGAGLFVGVGVLGSLLWQTDAMRLQMIELASGRAMWEVPTLALEDVEDAIAATACHKLVESGELTNQRVVTSALLERPTLTSACLSKSDPEHARRVANGLASPWLKGMFEHQGDEAMVCASASNLSTVVPHASYVVAGLLTCSLEAQQGQACCAKALSEHGLKGAALAQALQDGEDLTAGAWISGLLQAAYHQTGMDAQSKARAASLGLMSVEMRALALERACEALNPAPSDALMTQLVAVADAQCRFDARARRKDLSFWQRLCERADEGEQYNSDVLCEAGEQQAMSQATKQARAWVHAALGLKTIGELMGAIARGRELMSPAELVLFEQLEVRLSERGSQDWQYMLANTPEYYEIISYGRSGQGVPDLQAAYGDPDFDSGMRAAIGMHQDNPDLSKEDRAAMREALQWVDSATEARNLKLSQEKLSPSQLDELRTRSVLSNAKGLSSQARQPGLNAP